MKPRLKLDEAATPDGGTLTLFRHDQDYSIQINGQELMNSRQHESELELARLGCAHLKEARHIPCVLIGGLGLGYTLRQTLAILPGSARVVVAELMACVIDWNRGPLHTLNGHGLDDPRVELYCGDLLDLLEVPEKRYDAILLDIDNGPGALTSRGNARLYQKKGLLACRRALRHNGRLAIWSATPSKSFEHMCMDCRLHVRRFRVPAYPGSKSQARYVWVACEHPSALPPGGGAPLPRPGSKTNSRGPFRKGNKQ